MKVAQIMQVDLKKQGPETSRFLDGQLLIAMPGMEDPRFVRTVIYICSHNEQGGMGIIINRPAEHIGFSDMLIQLEVIPESEPIVMSEQIGNVEVMLGGPVETSRGFVLHSPDYEAAGTTMDIDECVRLTATVDILRAIARGVGPCDALLALGYAGWGPGQLETEIQANSWLTCPASPDILFHIAAGLRYETALERLGVELARLSSESGRA